MAQKCLPKRLFRNHKFKLAQKNPQKNKRPAKMTRKANKNQKSEVYQ